MTSRASSLQKDFQQIVDDSLRVCDFMERGQAATPLTDLLHQLSKDSQTKPLGVTLLALTSGARQSALKWLYGQNFAFLSLQVSQQPGLLEINLRDQGYSLEKSTGERLEFSDWDSFMAAVKTIGLMDTGRPPELRIATQAPTGVRNLQVLLPESSDFVNESPALLTRLLRHTNVLMVAAPPDYHFNDADIRVLDQLRDDMCVFWPLLPVDELSDDIHIPERGWWSVPRSLVSLPPTLLTTHIDAAIPPQLAEVRDTLREALLLSLSATRLQGAAEAISDRYEQEVKQLASRKNREQRKSEPAEAQVVDNSFWLQIRNELGDQCTALNKQLQEQNRKREAPTATGIVGVQQYLANLSYEDLNRESGYKVYKLSLSSEYVAGLTQLLQNQQRAALKEDITLAQRHLQKTAETIANKCQQQMGFVPTLSIPAWSENQLWQDLRENIGLELRYQGELPKRGFIDRLSEGRKGVMMLLMSVMLLGYVGIDVRNSGWLGLLIVPIFIGAIIYTYISFNKDEQHRLDKELGRVRDEINTSGRRLVSDLQRVKTNKLMDLIDATKKNWQQQLDVLARDYQARAQADKEQAASKARSRIQAIDTQIMEWNQYRLPLQKLASAAQQLISNSRNYLLELAKK